MKAAINDLGNKKYQYYAMMNQRRNQEFNDNSRVIDHYVNGLQPYKFPNINSILSKMGGEKESVVYEFDLSKKSCLRSGIDSSRDPNIISKGIINRILANRHNNH